MEQPQFKKVLINLYLVKLLFGNKKKVMMECDVKFCYIIFNGSLSSLGVHLN